MSSCGYVGLQCYLAAAFADRPSVAILATVTPPPPQPVRIRALLLPLLGLLVMLMGALATRPLVRRMNIIANTAENYLVWRPTLRAATAIVAVLWVATGVAGLWSAYRPLRSLSRWGLGLLALAILLFGGLQLLDYALTAPTAVFAVLGLRVLWDNAWPRAPVRPPAHAPLLAAAGFVLGLFAIFVVGKLQALAGAYFAN
jgi:hypothetical protein